MIQLRVRDNFSKKRSPDRIAAVIQTLNLLHQRMIFEISFSQSVICGVNELNRSDTAYVISV